MTQLLDFMNSIFLKTKNGVTTLFVGAKVAKEYGKPCDLNQE